MAVEKENMILTMWLVSTIVEGNKVVRLIGKRGGTSVSSGGHIEQAIPHEAKNAQPVEL